MDKVPGSTERTSKLRNWLRETRKPSGPLKSGLSDSASTGLTLRTRKRKPSSATRAGAAGTKRYGALDGSNHFLEARKDAGHDLLPR